MTTLGAESARVSPKVPEREVIARTLAYTLSGIVACLWTADPDLWGHLRFGLDAIRDRGLASIDPYSFTSDIPWINHEWLSEVAMAIAYLAAGVPGMLALKTALAGSALALLAWHARHTTAPARWWVLAAAAVLTAPVMLTLRPQLWTVLWLAVIATTTSWPLGRLALVWPIVFALWANLHGGWIVGLGVVGAWALGTVMDTRRWRPIVSLAGVWSLCAVATLLTPYGTRLWLFIRDTVGLNRYDISEWQPIWVEGASLWLASLILVGILLRRATWAWAAVLPVVMLGLASVKVGRLGGLWVVVAVGVLLPRWRKTELPQSFPPLLLAIVILVSILPSGFMLASESRCLRSYGWESPDFEAAGALLPASGRLMVPFGWGQYAIWHFGPRLKVSFDGRRETVYSAARIAEQHGLTSENSSILPFIQSKRPEYIWVPRPKGDNVANRLLMSGYRADITTQRSMILTRADLPALPPGSMSACFP